MTNDSGILTELKNYFSDRTDIAFSFLYGSYARGTLLVINDWKLYLDFMEIVTREAEDYAEMLSNDFLERYES